MQLLKYPDKNKKEKSMHTQLMQDNDGNFSKWKLCKDRKCSQCGSQSVKYREWDFLCGGYTDYNYCCQDCGYSWWIDGIDA